MPPTSSTAQQSTVREWLWLALVVVVYLLARLALLPARAEFTRAFTHDSGYLANVASNLTVGKGFVDDALWLVFLSPTSVPMPYHNANPLFPTVTAAIAGVNGDVFRSGFIVGVLASVILLVSIVALVRGHVRHPAQAAGVALAVVLFPPVLYDSFVYLTDALCAALIVAAAAVLVRPRSRAGDAAAGMLMGLAWLTRAATTLALPALVLYLVLRHPLRIAAARLAVISIAALIVVSPWLIHTKAVWGSYLRSDSEFSLVQDLAAEKSHGRSVMRFWHSTEPPPPLSAFVREAPLGFVKHEVAGAANVMRRTLSWWWIRSTPIGLSLSLAALLWCVERRRLFSPEGAALAVFGATTILVLAIRGNTFEERYVDTLTVFFALFGVLGTWRLWQLAAAPARRAVVLATIVLVWGVLVPLKIAGTYARVYSEDPDLVAYRAAAADVNRRFARGEPVVVGLTPYFYSIETSAVSLNFPDASDDYLLHYMDRYHARYVFLTGEEIDYWRPAWRSPAQLPDGLQLAGEVAGGYVFIRRSARAARASEPGTALASRSH